jgi:hypothetical protein
MAENRVRSVRAVTRPQSKFRSRLSVSELAIHQLKCLSLIDALARIESATHRYSSLMAQNSHDKGSIGDEEHNRVGTI